MIFSLEFHAEKSLIRKIAIRIKNSVINLKIYHPKYNLNMAREPSVHMQEKEKLPPLTSTHELQTLKHCPIQ